MSDEHFDPAFPCRLCVGHGGKAGPLYKTFSGMSLRDYFAAHALPGLLVRRWEDDTGKTPENVHRLWARAAYMLADEMLDMRHNAAVEQVKEKP
jgi:hypothetical protein